jgi:hypothetical protein
MTPNAITLLFKEVHETFPPIKGKPTDNDLLSIREMLLPILMEIPYDQLGGVHSLMAILMDAVRYAADHGGNGFIRPVRLPLYNGSIADNATTVVRMRAEVGHKACLDDYASFEAAERGAAKFLRETVNKVWFNDLKDADTFYTKVSALKIISFLDANSGELHAIDMISLRTNMHQYYVQADGIPQYINMLEDAQKKAKRAGMPIADIKLEMMASAAVLVAQHFPHEVDDWEGLPSSSRTWAAWKTAFCLAHLKRQHQILALGGGMANVVYCNDNQLLKKNYYFALSTMSASNPTQLLASHTGIANSGTSGFYFAPGVPVANLDLKAPTVGVRIANGLPVKSVASATLASAPSLPPAAMRGHVMPSLPHTLIGLGLFVNLNCQILFIKMAVLVFHPDGHSILEGWRKQDGPRLWHFPLKATMPILPEFASMRLETHAEKPVPRRSTANAKRPNTSPPQTTTPILPEFASGEHASENACVSKCMHLKTHAFSDACVSRCMLLQTHAENPGPCRSTADSKRTSTSPPQATKPSLSVSALSKNYKEMGPCGSAADFSNRPLST